MLGDNDRLIQEGFKKRMSRVTLIGAIAAISSAVPGVSLAELSAPATTAGYRSGPRIATALIRGESASKSGRGHSRRSPFKPYGPQGVSGREVSSAFGFIAPRGERGCGGTIAFGGDPYRVLVWAGAVRQSMSCRFGKAALMASVRWKSGTIRLGASDCAPVVVANTLEPSCRLRLPHPAGWTCEFRPGKTLPYWPLTCSTRGASLTAAWASPGIATQIVRSPSAAGPFAPPLSAFPSLTVWTGEVDHVIVHRERDERHRWLWSYEIYPIVAHQYVVIGVARSCGTSAGATEATMRSRRGDRLYFAQTPGSALGDKTRYIPLPPAGRYVVCDFLQRGPDAAVALVAGQRRFSVPHEPLLEPRPTPYWGPSETPGGVAHPLARLFPNRRWARPDG